MIRWRIFDLSDKTARRGQDEIDPAPDLAENTLTQGTEANFALVTGEVLDAVPVPLAIVHDGLIYDCINVRDALDEAREPEVMNAGLPNDAILLEHFKYWLTDPRDNGQLLSPLAGLAEEFLRTYHKG